MHEIIDVPRNVGGFAEQLAAAGVKTVIRYYNHRNGPTLTSKCLTRGELDLLHEAGLSVAVVFQQRGGSGGHLEDFTATTGQRDATRALELAGLMAQPNGSAIYFAVDHDFFRAAELDRIAAYFSAVKTKVAGQYAIGVYGSGAVGRRLKNAGLADLIWIAAARRWSGTQQALQDGLWTLDQRFLELHSPIGGFIYDGNVANPAFASFGQFGPAAPLETPRSAGVGVLMKVVARSGLNLRSGPGENFRIIQSLENGAVVTARGLEGGWMKIDLGGDGDVDGFMFAAFLRPLSGGLPLVPTIGQRPMDKAREELALNVAEFPGPANNPRIVLYHSTTSGGADDDETPWCSSFVNYCVEQAGFTGTDSKGARSWHDRDWGEKVNAPVDGDIVVFQRTAPGVNGGHVGFFVSADAAGITVLGGNQSNKVCIQRYPRNGQLGSFKYTLLSFRRAG